MLFYIFLYGSSDIYYMIAGFCIFNPFKEALPGHLHQLSGFFRNIANHNCPCCVGMIPLIDHSRIQTYNITIPDNMFLIWNSVYHFIINGYADGTRISAIIQEGWFAPEIPDHCLTDFIDSLGRNARLHFFCQFIMHNSKNSAGFPHKFYLFLRFSGNWHDYSPKISQIAAKTSFISTVPSTSFIMPFLL